MDIKVDSKTVVVFDLDDTLYNEIDFLRSAYLEIAKKVDHKNWLQLFSTMFSMYRCKIDVFGWLSSNYDIQKTSLVQLYRAHTPDIQPFEGAIDLINEIKKKHGKIGIITDGRSQSQRAKIKALGIERYIDTLVISEEIGSEKPSKKNYEFIENAFKGHAYWYIADNLRKDFITPNKMGWHTIALIDNGLNIHCDSHKYTVAPYLPMNFITSLRELTPIQNN